MITVMALSQAFKSPSQLVSAETALCFATSMQPSETSTDIDPPGWAKRDEQWLVDGLLGLYESKQQKITVFSKGIEYVAAKLSVPKESIECVVRLHEWSHAVFHLGVEQEQSFEIAKANLARKNGVQTAIYDDLTVVYNSVDEYVHEQVAQTITWLSLKALYANSTIEDAKKICGLFNDTFSKLTSRQPRRYQLDRLQQLAPDLLRSRLRALIGLIRSGYVRGDQKVWDTVMPW